MQSFAVTFSRLDKGFVMCYTGHSFVVKELYKATQGRVTYLINLLCQHNKPAQSLTEEQLMQTKHKIVYNSMPYGALATIPAGTPVTPAHNHPHRGYWVDNWKGMTATQKSWSDNYGYHVTDAEVE